MPYIVNFTDRENKLPITVYDNTSSTDTSLTFPGRNVSGYGQIIAENFLALLENFAKESQPVNPVEGQLWYDTLEGVLKIWDNTAWKAASNIQKGGIEPPTEESKIGELWVDTTNQQLYVYSGANWILVGPTFSTGLRSGPIVESVDDSQDQPRVILTFYVEDVPIIIFSKDSFTPKSFISGFSVIRSGLNITSLDVGAGTFDTKIWGTATTAENTEKLLVSSLKRLFRREARDVVNGANKKDFCGWLDTYYARWQTKLEEHFEDLELDAELAASHCKESHKMLLDIAGESTVEQLKANVEKCVESWESRAEQIGVCNVEG
jgi:hypothetical protein